MKSLVESKLERFARFLKEADEDQVEVVVTLTSSRPKQKDIPTDSRPTYYRVDIDMYLKTWGGGTVHAWEEDVDVFSAIDKVLDEVERQIIKLKQRRLEIRRIGAKEKEKQHIAQILPTEEREKPIVVEEDLILEKPMSLEDALLELQTTGIYFLPFLDASTGTLRIIYRKRGGNFGVINTKCKGL